MPIPKASCGVPVTSTFPLNATATRIRSARPYVLSAATGVLATATPVTVRLAVPPCTLWAAGFAIVWPLRLSIAFFEPSLIVPLFSDNALAPMLNPSASASDDATTYRNTSDAVPVPLA